MEASLIILLGIAAAYLGKWYIDLRMRITTAQLVEAVEKALNSGSSNTKYKARTKPKPSPAWRKIFPNVRTVEQLKSEYRRFARVYHPDRPEGSNEAMAGLNAAYQQALTDFQAGRV